MADFLLIHGSGHGAWAWRDVLPRLRALGHEARAIDLPGHGDSFKDMDLRYGLNDQVKYLSAILDALGVEHCHLAGNSMGGAVAALFAAAHPDRVRSLALFAPGGVYRHPSPALEMIRVGENPLIPRDRAGFERLMDMAMERPPFLPWPVTGVLAERAVADREIREKIFAEIHAPSGDRSAARLRAIRFLA